LEEEGVAEGDVAEGSFEFDDFGGGDDWGKAGEFGKGSGQGGWGVVNDGLFYGFCGPSCFSVKLGWFTGIFKKKCSLLT